MVGVLNHLLKAMKHALLAVYGSQSDSPELWLVIPLAFSNLALACLGGALLWEGGSGVEVLLIWDIHSNLLLAISFCCCRSPMVVGEGSLQIGSFL